MRAAHAHARERASSRPRCPAGGPGVRRTRPKRKRSGTRAEPDREGERQPKVHHNLWALSRSQSPVWPGGDAMDPYGPDDGLGFAFYSALLPAPTQSAADSATAAAPTSAAPGHFGGGDW